MKSLCCWLMVEGRGLMVREGRLIDVFLPSTINLQPSTPTDGQECPSYNWLPWLVVMMVLALRGISFADDEPPTKADPAKAASANEDASKSRITSKSQKADGTEQKADPPKEPSLLDKLSNELLKEVDDNSSQPKPEQKADKFDRVAKGMRSASEKLDGKETGDETTKIQEQVIRDLDELIKQLQNPPPNGGGGGGGGGGSSKSGGGGTSRQQRAGGRGGKGQPQGGTPKQPAQGNGGEQGGKERKDAEGSDERTDSERKAAAEAARKKKLEIDVWGHLPPHLREQLLNTYGERMLPKYEQLVKQFYEALSEQSESKPRR